MIRTKEEVNEMVKDIDADELCNYCKYSQYCPKAIKCYGGEPFFPYCAENDAIEYFDYESCLEAQEGEQE